MLEIKAGGLSRKRWGAGVPGVVAESAGVSRPQIRGLPSRHLVLVLGQRKSPSTTQPPLTNMAPRLQTLTDCLLGETLSTGKIQLHFPCVYQPLDRRYADIRPWLPWPLGYRPASRVLELTWCGSSVCSRFCMELSSSDTTAAGLLWQTFL